MIIFAVVLLSISCILLARGVYKLQKRVKDLHNETNNRVSQYYVETNDKFDKDINELNYLVREVESQIKSDNKKKLEKLTEQIIKKIPTTNEELLKEVKQMRDDFLALRQNF
jgi:TRAP-type C4-dicarboxylate transport system substrate-binding protein